MRFALNFKKVFFYNFKKNVIYFTNTYLKIKMFLYYYIIGSCTQHYIFLIETKRF